MKYTKRKSGSKTSRSWMTKKFSVAQVAKKALSGVQRLKQLVNVEHKYFDTYNTAGITTATGITQYPLTIVLQGDTYANRNGNSIRATNFHYALKIQNGLTNSSCTVRFLIVQDRSYATVATVIGDILENGAGTNLALMVASPKHINEKRFHILMDERIVINPQTITATTAIKYSSGFLSVKNHLHYSDTNPNTAIDTREGQLYAWLVTEDTSANIIASLYTRLLFTDN